MTTYRLYLDTGLSHDFEDDRDFLDVVSELQDPPYGETGTPPGWAEVEGMIFDSSRLVALTIPPLPDIHPTPRTRP